MNTVEKFSFQMMIYYHVTVGRTARIIGFCYTHMTRQGQRPLRLFVSKSTAKNAKERFWTIPTAISFLRIPLGYATAKAILIHAPLSMVLTTFGCGLATDLLDGWWAKLEGVTRWGSIIDPICDKIFMAEIAIALQAQTWRLVFYPLAVIETLLFLLSIIAIWAKKFDASAVNPGKTKFAFEGIACFALMIGFPLVGNLFLALALFFAVCSIKVKGPEIIRVLRTHRI